MGDFASLIPFSEDFGYDRGGPLDRYYIEAFLQQEAASVCGRVLEIGDNAYTVQFGGTKVRQSDVLHINADNEQATIIGDLACLPQVSDHSFDCIILTQTLHLIYDFEAALATCFRILRPGGTLLLTVPGLTPIDRGAWKETWYWSFTDRALQRMMEKSFPGAGFRIDSFGNVHVAAAFLYGLGCGEVRKEQLDYHDPHYPIVLTVKAIKPI